LKKEAKTFTLKADVVTGHGEVLGSAYPGRAAQVTIWRGKTVVAEARACLFRPDLLRAGLGHGHYGFTARLRQRLPPGRVALTLTSGDTRVAVRLTVPPAAEPPPCTVEALIAPPAGWTVADVLAYPACIAWADQLAALGVARFIDAAFRFVLLRWPSAAESGVHARALTRGTVSAEEFVTRLLRSRERADMKPALMSPFDPDFLFDHSVLSEVFPGIMRAHAE